ncbi:hypothetical protein H0A61_02528 [Koleobacter methoxysyntrophicus]|jgi:uncharacterized FlaG/YvyC family protein|uniref:DUF4264 domain-containing protein n=1 Tax=Koleobacter methoxysyntrophicus TaxID=2751313 RepID=A0A8A0RRF8_9FIRM|nr:YpmA family protein [Koleobacter methoxysyntrophicus]MDI3541078.1 hypothetical protein [Thermosediminibacterales bacterium]MDK2901114.1 hypothetical protein [Thermosediminibacterales bacterium]NPV42376.1 YpmA family protein [Bacillota bacterium]QSQ10130.1 hypothetical protein H0A61_02528 [Koleobacter methoxysyntrophicus]
MSDSGKLELIATKELPINNDLYKLIDFLNKTLKDKNLIFGLSKTKDSMIISVYET